MKIIGHLAADRADARSSGTCRLEQALNNMPVERDKYKKNKRN